MIPRHRSGELFGFFGVFDKFAGVSGSLAMMLAVAQTGPLRPGILSVAAFFVLGTFLFSRVDVEPGEREAEAAERGARLASVR